MAECLLFHTKNHDTSPNPEKPEPNGKYQSRDHERAKTRKGGVLGPARSRLLSIECGGVSQMDEKGQDIFVSPA